MAQKAKTEELRQYYVVKANDLIRKGRYNLTSQQQKIVLFAISKIKKNDDPHQFYELPIDEICAACGLELDAGGYYYRAIKNDMRKLLSPVFVQFDDNSEWSVAWFHDVGIVPLSGTVYVRFHEKIWPFLFDLRDRYTQYRLEEVLVFRSKYSIRLFEILRSHYTRDDQLNGIEKEIVIPVEHLRQQLDMTAYPAWKEFNRNVVKKAVDEINQYSEDLRVSYNTLRSGHAIDRIVFTVGVPEGFSERMKRYRNMRDRLPSGK